MQHNAIDDHYNAESAAATLKKVIEEIVADKNQPDRVIPITAVKWDDILFNQFTNPVVWCFCKESEEYGKMEIQFRVQGILYNKELPPISSNSASTLNKQARRFLQQHISLYGAGLEEFNKQIEVLEMAYMRIAGHFPDNSVKPWFPSAIKDYPGLEAHTRYFTHKSACVGARSLPLGEYVDPDGC
ncbi:hypothetical protein FA15DRAFT_707727 [Coprinopsis marcescibilis]|uniref:Uncharacterized protein n=1 Tax=Coprinopsis marcescibilis TaxID=230819 RepID=A0A5C3KL58_COPMA|nr:hypothetical protein FA15DRAFT_707727 [Coprinopsis marcescibilis]